MILVYFVITLFTHFQATSENTVLDLDDYTWKNRIVLVFADQNSSALLKQQVDHLLTDKPGLIDRNLLVFSIPTNENIKEVVQGDSFRVNDVLESQYNRKQHNFYVVLIGKDGGVKYKSDSLLESQRLYGIIDAMPMRQAEMRRSSSSN